MSARTGTPARIILSLVVVSLATGFAPAYGQEPDPQPAQQQKVHVVKRGDTLWGLAGFYFTNPFLWPTIFEANRDVVEDPHWIYPDERLRIPGVESGLPVAVRRQEPEPATGPAEPSTPAGPVIRPERTRFYTAPPPVDENRETDMAATRVPPYAVTPSEYYSAAWLEDAGAVGVRARLIGLADPGSQSDKLPQYLHPYDRVVFGWLRGGEMVVGDSMMLVRFGDRIGLLGDVIEPVALVRIDSVRASTASAVVVNQYGEARIGDYLIPAAIMPEFQRGRPAEVADGPEGTLIAWLDREPLYGTMDDGFIDVGSEAGVTVGDEFVAYVPPRPGPAGAPELPREEVGTLRVIKVMPNSSTVRVSGASSTALQRGVRVRLVRKMP